MYKTNQVRIVTTFFIVELLMMLLLVVVESGAASADSTVVKSKTKEEKMKSEHSAKSYNPVELPDSIGDTAPGAHEGLNSVDILSHSSINGKQNVKENSFENLDEEKQIDHLNEYNKLHSEPPIGDATMDDDGTIRVRIRMLGGMHADGNVSYAKNSEHYESILKHLGGMKPGDVKLVPPWPDEDSSKEP